MTEETADIGNWVEETVLDLMVEQRIACDERGYPQCEARFCTIAEWEAHTGKSWDSFVAKRL